MSISGRVSGSIGSYLLVISTAFAIDVNPANGPGDAITLATMLVGSPEITVDAATFNIDLIGQGTQPSNIRAIGSFVNGNDATGYPAINQPATGGPISYTGGIGIDAGVCLCTGLVSDSDPASSSATTGSGVGIEGPNNGFAISQITPDATTATGFQSELVNGGECSYRLQTSPDRDFITKVNGDNVAGDATVLQFNMTLSAPGYLRLSFVIATDENPAWIDPSQIGDFNDSVGIFVRQNTIASTPFENIATVVVGGVEQPLSMQELDDCGEPIFFNNQIAPAPTGVLSTTGNGVGELRTSDHGFDNNGDGFNLPNDNEDYYNHEFGGFTKILTRETKWVLTPGTHTVKIVIQDVFDFNVDSGVFLESNSLKLYAFLPADFDLDGDVDNDDYLIYLQNYNQPGGFTDGDANGDGVVSYFDLVILMNNWLATGGNVDLSADFNRDSCVDGSDLILLQRYINDLEDCASRFEGDANGDGKVDGADQSIFNAEFGLGCGGSQQAQSGGGGTSAAVAGPQAGLGTSELQPIPVADSAPTDELSPEEQLLQEADLDGDGQIDTDELLVHWIRTTGGTPE